MRRVLPALSALLSIFPVAFIALVTLSFQTVAHGAEMSLLRGDSACVVLATNMYWTATEFEKLVGATKAEQSKRVEEAKAYHSQKVDECFTTPEKCIFTDKAKAHEFVAGQIDHVADLVFKRHMPADAVGGLIMEMCTRLYHPAESPVLPNGIEPKGPQIQS
jgi:hypothetical protein